MKTVPALLLLFVCCCPGMNAQELPLITDKPGTFEILRRSDYVDADCGFTRAEITANLERITALVNSMRKNPVLSDIRGFDGKARIYNIGCREPGGFGIPSRISFEFCSWYRQKDGTPYRGCLEPPCWDVLVNKLIPNVNRGIFSADDYYADPRFFLVSSNKKTIERGIDVYGGENFVIYDPDRPPYWSPVTLKEAFGSLIGHWSKNPDKTAAELVLKEIEKAYAAIPESERNNPAYYGGMPIPLDATGAQIMQVSPGYWNRSLPTSAIQFVCFKWVQGGDYYRRRKEEYLQHNSTSYSEYRFLEALSLNDIRALVPLIGK